jgi:hypothetical protein
VSDELPAYEDLPVVEGTPAGSSWGLWGSADTLGALSLPDHGYLHRSLLPLPGLPLGEVFDLDALAEDCEGGRTDDALITSAVVHVPRGVASQPHSIAIR